MELIVQELDPSVINVIIKNNVIHFKRKKACVLIIM